jgi:hypothetical protein
MVESSIPYIYLLGLYILDPLHFRLRIDPIDTSNGSFDFIARITSSPLSLKKFNLESSCTSNKKRSDTLKVALTSY